MSTLYFSLHELPNPIILCILLLRLTRSSCFFCVFLSIIECQDREFFLSILCGPASAQNVCLLSHSSLGPNLFVYLQLFSTITCQQEIKIHKLYNKLQTANVFQYKAIFTEFPGQSNTTRTNDVILMSRSHILSNKRELKL